MRENKKFHTLCTGILCFTSFNGPVFLRFKMKVMDLKSLVTGSGPRRQLGNTLEWVTEWEKPGVRWDIFFVTLVGPMDDTITTPDSDPWHTHTGRLGKNPWYPLVPEVFVKRLYSGTTDGVRSSTLQLDTRRSFFPLTPLTNKSTQTFRKCTSFNLKKKRSEESGNNTIKPDT